MNPILKWSLIVFGVGIAIVVEPHVFHGSYRQAAASNR